MGQINRTIIVSAARRDHLVKKIIPAVQQGDAVICDRFADSTIAYQCFGYGFDETVYKQASDLYALIAGTFHPNLTIILDKNEKIDFLLGDKGKFDYCYAFIESAFNNLNETGKTSYLIPNSIFKNVFGKMI